MPAGPLPPDTPYTYFVFLTVLKEKEHALVGVQSGADDYLPKPLDPLDLRICLIAAERVVTLHRSLDQKTAELEREAREAAALREARARLKPKDRVHVPRFDKPGQVVRVDHKRNVAVVSVGLGQWEFPLDEVVPLDS